MSKFRTVLKPSSSERKIGLNDPILTIGSCFADAIGGRLKRFKLNTLDNPFGVMFNPVSIHKLLEQALSNQAVISESLIRNQDVFYHYDFHSDFSALESDDLTTKINNAIKGTHEHLKRTNWLIITYGTAWVYTHKEYNNIVANCHKMPASIFDKSLLNEQKIVESFETLHSSLLKINPEIQILLTVSPVRHIKDTLELNAVSKSILRIACHSLSTRLTNVHYYPAYEIMMDDLRDYRFYNADLIHPSPAAEEYIWDHFTNCMMDEPTKVFIEKWNQILKDIEHRAFHPESAAHQSFIQKLRERIETFAAQVDVENEIRYVENQLINRKE